MSSIYLDDQSLDVETDQLAEAIAAAQGTLEGGDRLVVEIQLDGETLNVDQLQQQATLPDSSELRLYSATPSEIARQALTEVRQQLVSQQQVIAEAAEWLQQDKGQDAFTAVIAANEVWQLTVQAVEQAAQLIGVDLSTLSINDQPFSSYTASLFTRLTELKQQVQDQDTAALADALAYEWPELIEQWDAVLGELIEKTQK